jgi:hypothetical protein
VIKDYPAHLETLRRQASEAALISALATEPRKREIFASLAEHLNTLAAEVERSLAAGVASPDQRRLSERRNQVS